MTSDTILQFFATYIEAELGIVYSEHNRFQLHNRLEEITRLIGAPTIEDLYKEQSRTGISGAFKQLLLDIATNNETLFFRDPKTYQAIQDNVLNNYTCYNGRNEKLRIWSAACSTGQEPLSIAMMIKEWNKKTDPPISFSVVATDISERVLEKAKSATYTRLEVQRGLHTSYLERYFQPKERDKWMASPELTKHIEFKKANLKKPFEFLGKFHLILCRNVLIYQSIEGKKEIIERIIKQLEPNGILVLGAGETLFGISEEFDLIRCDGVILYRRKTKLAIAS